LGDWEIGRLGDWEISAIYLIRMLNNFVK